MTICCFIALSLQIFGLFFFALFGIVLVMPKSVIDFLECWQGHFRCYKVAKVWQVISLRILWTLWHKSCRRKFDGVEWPTFVIEEFLLRSLYDWMAALGSIPLMSCFDFIHFDFVYIWLYSLQWDRHTPLVCDFLFFLNKILI